MLFQDAIARHMPVLPFDSGRISIRELILAKLGFRLISLLNSAIVTCSTRTPRLAVSYTPPAEARQLAKALSVILKRRSNGS